MPSLLGMLVLTCQKVYVRLIAALFKFLENILRKLNETHGPKSLRVIGYPSGAMVLNITVLFAIALIVIFVS